MLHRFTLVSFFKVYDEAVNDKNNCRQRTLKCSLNDMNIYISFKPAVITEATMLCKRKFPTTYIK